MKIHGILEIIGGALFLLAGLISLFLINRLQETYAGITIFIYFAAGIFYVVCGIKLLEDSRRIDDLEYDLAELKRKVLYKNKEEAKFNTYAKTKKLSEYNEATRQKSDYCLECGAKLISSSGYCSNCGHQN